MARTRDNIEQLHAYVPGEQPTHLQTGQVIKLNTNENPYPPSPAVMRAIAQLPAEALRLYPPADAKPFREAAAKVHRLDPSQVIATNGGDELLRLLVTVFCEPSGQSGKGGIGVTHPTYSLYNVLASIHDTPVVSVERGDDFAPADDTAQRWNDAGCSLAFLVNPHAPTGRFKPLEKLRALAEVFDGVLVIDEAYIDFAPQSALPLIAGPDALDNVVLLRSLSKGYSLAGLRFGYGLSSPSIIAALDKARDSYNTDALAQAAATAAVTDQDYASGTWRAVIAQRVKMAEQLTARGFEVWPSPTNFLLVTPPSPAPQAEEIYRSLKARDILVRYFDSPRLADKLRITIGTPQQNDAVLAAIDALPGLPKPSDSQAPAAS